MTREWKPFVALLIACIAAAIAGFTSTQIETVGSPGPAVGFVEYLNQGWHQDWSAGDARDGEPRNAGGAPSGAVTSYDAARTAYDRPITLSAVHAGTMTLRALVIGRSGVDVHTCAGEFRRTATKTAPGIKAGSMGGPTAGKPFSPGVRQQELANNPSTCVYCRMETDTPQVDHVIPRVRGGNATVENAQTTCPHCNSSKGARDFPVTPPAGYEGPWPPPWWPR